MGSWYDELMEKHNHTKNTQRREKLMELLEQLELVGVEQDQDKTTFTFLDRERGEIRDVKWNSKKYDPDATGNNKWIQSDEQEQKVQEYAQEYFGVDYSQLANIGNDGIKKDIYTYPKFNSLWESNQTAKFDMDMEGQLLSVTVKELKSDDVGLHILFDYDGDTYDSKMGWSKYIEADKTFFVDPIKKQKQIEKFEEKFGIPFDDRDELVGKDIMVEVELAFNKYVYVSVKPLPKKKK